MPFKYAKLRGRIVEKYGTLERFSNVVALSTVAVSKKLNGRTQFSAADMELWCQKLTIDLKDVGEYFFD